MRRLHAQLVEEAQPAPRPATVVYGAIEAVVKKAGAPVPPLATVLATVAQQQGLTTRQLQARCPRARRVYRSARQQVEAVPEPAPSAARTNGRPELTEAELLAILHRLGWSFPTILQRRPSRGEIDAVFAALSDDEGERFLFLLATGGQLPKNGKVPHRGAGPSC
jgi:hypothetical protein